MLSISCTWGQRRNPSGLQGRRLKAAVVGLGLLTAVASGGGRAEAADPVTRGNAYGEQISLKLQTLLATLQASSGPLSTVSGDTSPFNKDASALSLNVALGAYGTVLHTGLLLSHTDSASPRQVSSNATVHDLGISLVPVAPLLTLHADEVRSSAVIGGTCGSALTATGSSTLVNAGAGGTLGLGLQIGASVPANTVLLNLLGIRIALNEQIVGGDGITSRTISVNAIHVSVQNSLLGPLGKLTSDIVIAHSDAQVVCAPPPPPPPPPPAPKADLGVSLAAAPNPVTVGQTVTYTLTVSNAGPSTATATTLSDALPGGVSLISAQPSQGGCTGTTTLSCSLGTISPGGSVSIVIQGVPNAAGRLTDSASVTSGVTDPDTSNNNAAVTVDAIDEPGEADLAISLGADPDPVQTDQVLTFFVDIANFGPSDAVGVRLSDVLPAGVTLISVQPAQGSCTGTATLSCSLGTIAAGNDVSIEIQVVPNTAGTLTDTASATSSVDDPDTSNNDATVTVTANGPSADLALSLTANPHPVLVGQVLTYTLTITNAGPSDATDVTLSNQFPATVSLVSVQPSQGSCSGTTTLSCSLGAVISGADASIEIQVIPNQAGQITDTASVTNSTSDPDLSNNSASITVIVYTGQEPQADLSLTKRANVDRIGVGAQFTYTVTITNAGPDDATGVVMTDPLPAGMTLVSLQASQGDCSGTDTVTCNLGTVANGASATLILTVISQESGNVVNQASVASSSIDLNDANNSDSATVSVRSAE
jgi:uncharacterized repeat protein (TIGR01451 family)